MSRWGHPRRVKPMAERFWSKVDRSPGHGPWGDCWLWTAYAKKGAYGRFGVSKQVGVVEAHRVAYELSHGPIPPGQLVTHLCNVRLCQNPDHLKADTYQGNTDYMVACGRMARGGSRPMAKLNERSAAEAKRRLAAGESTASIGKSLGVSWGAIQQIKRGRNWSHVSA